MRSIYAAILMGTLQVLQNDRMCTIRSCGVLLQERLLAVATYTSVSIADYRSNPAKVKWSATAVSFMYAPVRRADGHAAGTRTAAT